MTYIFSTTQTYNDFYVAFGFQKKKKESQILINHEWELFKN